FYHHFDVIRSEEERPPALTVRVCESVTCAMYGSAALEQELCAKLDKGVRVQRVPCVGRCAAAPVAVVGQNPVEQA
ncbi:MAG: NAD(P)H-dependent oxidoreductase subunit E, partial [Gammaproteobacteria bacterium]